MPDIGDRIGRVRLEAFLGRGGMGEVYRGFDEVLKRKVAVKTLRGRHRLEAEARTRFLREARLLSRLDHPNICRIYEVQTGAEADYLILEYVEGRRLDELMEEGLDREEALEVTQQIAGALAAAHERKIVHRDLKPQNIMVTPSGQAKILDFGVALVRDESGESRGGGEGDPATDPGQGRDRRELAAGPTALGETLDLRPGASGGRDRTVSSDVTAFQTAPGSVIGTLAYMSPEQAAGEEVDEASDLYSLGTILQELFTGEGPYEETASQVELAEKVQAADTRSPEGIEPALARLVEALHSRDPEARPSAEAVVTRIRDVRRKPERRRRRRLTAAAALVVASILIGAILITWRLARPPALLPEGQQARVAVLPFYAARGEADLGWVEHGLQELVAATLGRTEGIKVLSPEQVGDAVERLRIDQEDGLERGELELLERALGSNLILAVRVQSEDSGYRFWYSVFGSERDLHTGQLASPGLIPGARELTAVLSGQLSPGAPLVDLEEEFSTDAFSNQAYAIGIQKSRAEGPEAARLYFRVCLDRDPSFLRARLQLALSRFKTGETGAAERTIREVVQEAEARGDRGLRAEALRQLGTIQRERGDYDEAEEIFRRVLAMEEESGDDLNRAATLGHLGVISYRRGEFEEAEEVLKEALSLSRTVGSGELEPRLLTPMAFIRLRNGDLEGAEELLREALAGSRNLGDREWAAGTLTNLSIVALRRQDLDRAEEYTRQALSTFEEMENVKGQLVSRVNLGVIRLNRGDTEDAEHHTRRALALAKRAEDRRSESFALSALGYFAAKGGRLEEADSDLRLAGELAGEMDDRELSWQIARNLAYLRVLQGRLDEAERLLDRAREIKRDYLTILVEARLAYARGRLEEAVRLQEEAREHPGAEWSPQRQEVLETYRRAAVDGRRIPLPDESNSDPE